MIGVMNTSCDDQNIQVYNYQIWISNVGNNYKIFSIVTLLSQSIRNNCQVLLNIVTKAVAKLSGIHLRKIYITSYLQTIYQVL
jgi:hypothetical protein